jgi:hypothetical protein
MGHMIAAVNMKGTVFCDVVTCSLRESYKYFGQNNSIHIWVLGYLRQYSLPKHSCLNVKVKLKL